MNNLYPHATAEELAAADNVCIICREEMQVGMYNRVVSYTVSGSVVQSTLTFEKYPKSGILIMIQKSRENRRNSCLGISEQHD